MASNRNSPHGRWPRGGASIDDERTAAAGTAPRATIGSINGCDAPAGCESQPAGAKKELPMRHSFPGTLLPGIRTRATRSGLQPRMSEAPGPAYPWPQFQQEAGGALTGLCGKMAKPFARARARVAGFTFLDWLQLFLPCVKWLRTYKVKEYLLWDIIAGVSVGFMVVPQGMSYANIAGVPSVYGLYGAFMPVLVYALFGSSKELAVGPVAVTSLLISSSLKELVPGAEDITNPNNPPPDMVGVQQQYNQHAIQLSLLVACMYTAVGVFNLGFLTNFLSHSVIGGFTSGAAIIIGMSQLKYILGYSVPRADKVQEQVHAYIAGIQGFVWQEYIMGVTILTMLLTMKYYGKRHPKLKWLRPLGPISACVIAIIAAVAGDLEHKGIRIVGKIPKGLPSPTVSMWMPMSDFSQLAPLALVVMLVDLLESTSIARALAAKGKYQLAANQEIVGLGLANFAGSAFNAYSTTGSFSRSAVNYDSGCKTGLSGFVTACVVGLVLLVLTPVFEKLPLNVMGAIVVSGVSGLFEYEQAVHLFKVRKLDWLVWMTSFCSTMFLGVEIGLAISIGLALLIVVYESAFPHTALLGRVGNTTIYRNVKQFPNSQVLPGIAACRVDAPMYFANVQYIHDRLRKYVARAGQYSEAGGMPLQYLLLDMSPVTHIDSTGAHLLESLHEEMGHQGVQLGLCNPGAAVVELLERTGFPEVLGREWIFVRMHDAVVRCLATMVACGHPIKPTAAIDSAAVSPRAAQALLDSPLARQSTRGTPADTDATLLCSFDVPGALQHSSSHAGEALLGAGGSPRCGNSYNTGGSVVVPIDAQLAAALVPTLSRGYSGNVWLPAAGSVRFAEPGEAAAAAAAAAAGVLPAGCSSSMGVLPELRVPSGKLDRHSPFAAAYGGLNAVLAPTVGVAAADEQQQQQQVPRPSRLSGAGGSSAGSLSSRPRGSSGGGSARAGRGDGPYSEALLSSPAHTPTAADAALVDAADAPPSSGSAAGWNIPR
ncbi:hypothetical protein OEZ86_012573 [Tetradesmus obliquus]|nr:hypothetical protein OEZ86_012573 [Tetradesmus obliquus]